MHGRSTSYDGYGRYLLRHELERGLQMSRRTQSTSREGTVAVILIVLALTFLIWSPACIRRIRNLQTRRDSGRRLTDAELEAAILRRMTEANLALQALRPSMSPADRREYIDNVLLPKKVVISAARKDGEPESDGTVTKEEDTKEESNTPVLVITKEEGSPEDEDHCCAICLNEYKDGDEVCQSNNKYCSHFFHRQCIREWLMTHEECPCCRHYYLFFVEDDAELAEVEGRNGQGHPPAIPSHYFVRLPSTMFTAADPYLGYTSRSREQTQDSDMDLSTRRFPWRQSSSLSRGSRRGDLPQQRIQSEQPSNHAPPAANEEDDDNSAFRRGLRLFNYYWRHVAPPSDRPTGEPPPVSSIELPSSVSLAREPTQEQPHDEQPEEASTSTTAEQGRAAA